MHMPNDTERYWSKEGGLGTRLRINSVRFLNKEKLKFLHTERVRFQIEAEAFDNVSNLHLGMTIKSADSTVIGFENVALPSVQRGEKYIMQFETTFCELPAGGYYLHFNLHQENDMGYWITSIDQTPYVRFAVEDDGTRLQWRRDWFGYVDFQHMKFIE